MVCNNGEAYLYHRAYDMHVDKVHMHKHVCVVAEQWKWYVLGTFLRVVVPLAAGVVALVLYHCK